MGENGEDAYGYRFPTVPKAAELGAGGCGTPDANVPSQEKEGSPSWVPGGRHCGSGTPASNQPPPSPRGLQSLNFRTPEQGPRWPGACSWPDWFLQKSSVEYPRPCTLLGG